MKTAKFLVTTLLLMHFTGPALAGEKARSAMRYTAMKQQQENSALRSIEFDNNGFGNNETVEEQGATAQNAWDRYRALASGKTEEEADELARNDDKPKKMKQVQAAEAAPPHPAAATETTGLVGLIKQYQENKQKQGGMRSMTISSPSAVHKRQIAEKADQTSSEQGHPEE